MPPRRGDLYYIVPLDNRGVHAESFGHMHVVVSRNEINQLGKTVIVVPLVSPEYKDTGDPKNTGAYRKQRIRIPEEQRTWDADAPHKQDGDSLAKTEQMFCISQELLGRKCGKLSDIAMNSLESGLCYVLNIPEIGRAAASLAAPGKPIQPPVKPR